MYVAQEVDNGQDGGVIERERRCIYASDIWFHSVTVNDTMWIKRFANCCWACKLATPVNALVCPVQCLPKERSHPKNPVEVSSVHKLECVIRDQLFDEISWITFGVQVPCVILYNRWMGAVDYGDQLRGYYSCRTKSQKYFLFDMTTPSCISTSIPTRRTESSVYSW